MFIHNITNDVTKIFTAKKILHCIWILSLASTFYKNETIVEQQFTYVNVKPEMVVHFFLCHSVYVICTWRDIITGPLAVNGITESIYSLLHENCRQYSRGNVKSASLKIIFLLVKYSLLAAV